MLPAMSATSPSNPFYQIILDSLGLLTQNFVLTYPLLLFFLLLSVVVPSTETPAMEARWFVLGFGIFLIHCAVMAGSYSMISRGVCLHFEREERFEAVVKEKPESLDGGDIEIPNPFEDFVVLLREFFPGVSRFFLQFVLGTLIQALVLGVIYWWFSQALENMGGYPALFRQLTDIQATTAGAESAKEVNLQAMMLALSPEEKAHLNQFTSLLLAAMSIYGVFYFLSIFWSAFIVLGQKPFWQAYLGSFKQAFTRPVVLIGLAMLFIGLTLSLSLLAQLGSTMFIALWHFLNIMLNIYFAIVTVMIVASSGVRPVFAEQPDDDNG